jgi:hypothetical protein
MIEKPAFITELAAYNISTADSIMKVQMFILSAVKPEKVSNTT